MALNYSQRPIFPAHTSEDNMVSPLRIVNGYVVEGLTEKPRHGNGEICECFGYGREKVDKGGSPDPVSADIIDLLPSDPFGMDIDISTTFTAITGWLEDLEVDYGAYVRNSIVNTNEDYELFAGLNLIWNRAMRFQSFPSNEAPDDKGGAGSTAFDFGSTSAVFTKGEDLVDDFRRSSNTVGGDPHEAFVLALSYLGTKDLLLVGRVCRSLCSTIHNDSLLWRNIYIDQPLNERITDDVLVQLTNRADGNLSSLTLVKCPRITDDGLKRVLETNPKLTKLSIPGCTRLSIEGILTNLKAFKSNEGTSGVKQIRTGGFYGITLDHYKELKFLLGSDEDTHQNNYSPHYYHRGNLYLPSDDNRDIDVEICSRCQNVRLVYDCPADSCQVKDESADLCRACIICIPRCAQCGRCVHNSEYEETFSLEYLCSGCIIELPSCHVAQPMEVDVPGGTVCFHG
ncbi:putative F-box domain, leucine-rich repeat domain superfamily, F-box-like domain superfamily [Helianthus annuus]|uniref:F-box domain, leucine-rich repeat domain superfamily, F-box-like domain superfamily n=1 Tax=Helianthus annuus TaxID=4232 RepID=A0A251UI61_HELAN|nr:F-box protein SKIP14 [Helianthus annuus]XP_021970077.1 F-box protein SKIP14 [Helianthus annuus]KAF5801920.1 putative F-box domain, leucine-rich repeat domain superfamily, F-box-like domain superfamily [Helianthus annuus]KAJ0560155.1 putative F-box domain, leucine-rich repeat domain superfamily, F-box-like domain superfamily [Helianthus annuus]KAJ0566392.1 putative F-box domain, leucine-rich repeat domain superfamily, F-box-like domain superfamily [Helianthus annuus]KAJ0573152.1 putative F-b